MLAAILKDATEHKILKYMYYRVKQFREKYVSMFVLDKDTNLANLKSRTIIQDCAEGGYRPFDNPTFIEKQEIQCVSLGGRKRNTDIIKEPSL